MLFFFGCTRVVLHYFLLQSYIIFGANTIGYAATSNFGLLFLEINIRGVFIVHCFTIFLLLLSAVMRLLLILRLWNITRYR